MYQKKERKKEFFFGGLGEEKSPENVLGGSIKWPRERFHFGHKPWKHFYWRVQHWFVFLFICTLTLGGAMYPDSTEEEVGSRIFVKTSSGAFF